VDAGRVVVVDDDTTLLRTLEQRLRVEGYAVTVLDAPSQLEESPDCFDADVVVSSVAEGSDVERLRRRSDVLFLAMLPPRVALTDALDVVDAGADAFVTKPFATAELLTKLRALLRRSGSQEAAPRSLQFDGLSIDLAAREVLVRGEPVALPAREFDLLAFLATSPRQVLSRLQIMTNVWSIDDGFGTATVTEHVRRLRTRIELDPAHPRWIQTVWSVGYRFMP
jgi:DNA-binding response OmpR family regulator